MIKYTPACERELSLFRTPYEQNLLPDNPWVQMEAVVPWDELAKIFFKSMSSNKGWASVDLRLVIGAMLVKHIEAIILIFVALNIIKLARAFYSVFSWVLTGIRASEVRKLALYFISRNEVSELGLKVRLGY